MQPLPKFSAQKAVYAGVALLVIRPDRHPARRDDIAAARTARPQGHEQQARATNELLRSDTNTIYTKRGNVFRDVTSLFYGLNMDILDIIKSHANDIKTRFSVRRIGIFGSFARGEEKASSDIDILVEFEKPTFKNFMNLSFYLEDLLGREVDLVTVKGLHQRIRPYVEKDVIWSE